MKKIITKRILNALFIAIRVHGTARRKGDGKLYLIHPLAVFRLLRRWGTDEDVQIAGLLHDVLEDAPAGKYSYYRKLIETKFGFNVLEIVEGVTEQDKSLPWKDRKKKYLEHLKVATERSLFVSCADMTHNMNSLVDAYRKQGEKVWKHFNGIKQWKVLFIDQRVAILKERLPEFYTEELITHLGALNKLLSQPLPPEYQSVPSDISKDDKKAIFVFDPLYQSLWDHCMLTEQEMESGMLEDTKINQ